MFAAGRPKLAKSLRLDIGNDLGTWVDAIESRDPWVRGLTGLSLRSGKTNSLAKKPWLGNYAVRERGFEPPRPKGHWHLKPARLPFRHSR